MILGVEYFFDLLGRPDTTYPLISINIQIKNIIKYVSVKNTDLMHRVKLPQCYGIVLSDIVSLLHNIMCGVSTKKVKGASPQSTMVAQSRKTFSPTDDHPRCQLVSDCEYGYNDTEAPVSTKQNRCQLY